MEDIQRIQKEGNQRPILVDAKLHSRDPLETSYMILDPDKYSAKEIQEYKETYNVFGQPALSEILKSLED